MANARLESILGFSAKIYGIMLYSYDFTIPGITNNRLHKKTYKSRKNIVLTTFKYTPLLNREKI